MTEKKLTHEEFIVQAIHNLRKYPYKGIHSNYSGFNSAFRKYFEGDNPIEATRGLEAAGKVKIQSVKGGVMLYLVGDEPVMGSVDDTIEKVLHGRGESIRR